MRVPEYCGADHRRWPPIRAVVIHHSFTRDMDALGPAGGAMPARASCVPVLCLGLVGAPDSAGSARGEAS
jgi:hypothetical protein